MTLTSSNPATSKGFYRPRGERELSLTKQIKKYTKSEQLKIWHDTKKRLEQKENELIQFHKKLEFCTK